MDISQIKPHASLSLPETSGNTVFSNKQKNNEVLRQAMKHGFVKNISREIILEHSGRKDFSEIQVLHLSGLQLRGTTTLELCYRLKVCILSHNYVANFDALEACNQLVKLDLSHNQISKLPSGEFWDSLTSLKMLYLHDNSIGRLASVQNLAYATSLQVLTLYDTPISLRQSYRHHVVNSVFSLKVLDQHVISDEEIIEDAQFGGKFRALSSHFYLQPMPPLPKGSSIGKEMRAIHKLLASVNHILAHHSPVLIVQKMVRGYFARKFIKYLMENRIWVRTSALAQYSQDDMTQSFDEDPGTTLVDQDASLEKDGKALESADLQGVQPSEQQIQQAKLKDMFESRDTYRSFNDEDRTIIQMSAVLQEANGEKSMSKFPTTPVSSPRTREIHGLNKRIKVNLKVLEIGDVPMSQRIKVDRDSFVIDTIAQLNRTEQGLTADDLVPPPPSKLLNPDVLRKHIMHGAMYNRAADPLAPTLGSRLMQAAGEAHRTTKEHRKIFQQLRQQRLAKKAFKSVEEEEKVRASYETGVVEIVMPEVDEEGWEDIDQDEEPTVQYRLHGFKKGIVQIDFVKEMLEGRVDAGRNIRKMHDDAHMTQDARPPSGKSKNWKSQGLTLDQQIYAKTKGCMSLATITAVDKAYRDRDKELINEAKRQVAHRVKESYTKGKERIKMFELVHKGKAIRQEKAEKRQELLAKKERDNYYKDVNGKYMNHAEKSKEFHQKRMAEFAFANNFNCHRSSVAKALTKHDIKSRLEDQLVERVEKVKLWKMKEEEQMELVRKYLEHRKKLLQSQSVEERMEIDSKMLQEENERLMSAQNRVARLRSQRRLFEELYPVPLHVHVAARKVVSASDADYDQKIKFHPHTPPSQLPPLARIAERKILTNRHYLDTPPPPHLKSLIGCNVSQSENTAVQVDIAN